MKRSFNWKDLGVAYSLANLWFIASWQELIFSTMYNYDAAGPNSALEYLAVFINVLLVTAILFALIRVANTTSSVRIKGVFQFIFLVFGVVAFCSLSFVLIEWLSPKTVRFPSLPLPAVVLAVCVVFAIGPRFGLSAIAENLKRVALFLLPFSLIIILESFREQLFTDPNIFLPQSVQKAIPIDHQSPLNKKVVWIVFDEFDYAALTAAQKNNTDLQDFERLTDQSFVAQNAFSPNNRTQESIPSLLTGKPLWETTIISPNDLLLYPDDGAKSFSFRNSDSIFTEMENMGGKSAIIGWFHPYPRIFHEHVSYCYWRPYSDGAKCSSGISGFGDCALTIFLGSLLQVPLATTLFPSLNTVSETLIDYQYERNHFLTGKAIESISNYELDLLFFHFSTPHWPFIARNNMPAGNYFSSLEVVNDTLRELRATLENTGQWDKTVFIISSDHSDRGKRLQDFEFLPEAQRVEALNDHRIPFIVSFPGQKSRIDYLPTLNTVITKQLIENIFKEKIRSSEDLVLWLDDLQRTQPGLINRQSVGRKE